MDPLSITVAVIALVETTSKVTIGLTSFIRNTRGIDNTVKQLSNETLNFQSGLHAVRDAIEDPQLRLPASEALWGRIEECSGAAKSTILELSDIVQQLGGGRTRAPGGTFSSARAAWKMIFEQSTIDRLRLQMQSHDQSLSMILQILTLRAAVNASTSSANAAPAVAIDALDRLEGQLESMQESLQSYKDFNRMLQTLDRKLSLMNDRLEITAAEVRSDATEIFDQTSTALGETRQVPGSSLAESVAAFRAGPSEILLDDHCVAARPVGLISEWLLQNGAYSTPHEAAQRGFASSQQPAGGPIIPMESSMATFEDGFEDEDEDEDDFEMTLALEMVRKSEAYEGENKLALAEQHLRDALQLARERPEACRRSFNETQHTHKLALLCLKQDKLMHAEVVCNDAMQVPPNDDGAERQNYYITMFILIQVYVRRGDLDRAYEHCKRLVRAQQKLQDASTAYWVFTALLAAILDFRGRSSQAQALRSQSLPPGFEVPQFLPPMPELSGRLPDPSSVVSQQYSTADSGEAKGSKHHTHGDERPSEEPSNPYMASTGADGVERSSKLDGRVKPNISALSYEQTGQGESQDDPIGAVHLQERRTAIPSPADEEALARNDSHSVSPDKSSDVRPELTSLSLLSNEGDVERHSHPLSRDPVSAGFSPQEGNASASEPPNDSWVSHTPARLWRELSREEVLRAQRVLLSAGHRIDRTSFDPDEALLWASKDGHLDIVLFLLGVRSLEKYRRLLGVKFGAKRTMRPANVDAKYSSGMNSLFLAIKAGHDEVAMCLIERGIDLQYRPVCAAFGWSRLPRCWGCQTGPIDLSCRARAKNALEYAIGLKRRHLVRRFVQAGCPVRGGDPLGRTPLFHAAYHGAGDICRDLLLAGSDTEARDNPYGEAPLHTAAIRSHEAVVQLLLQHGADANVKQQSGKTALHQSARAGRQDIVELLIAAGAEVNTTGADSWTALHQATSCGHQKVVALLIAAGVEVDKETNGGSTALHQAASCGHQRIVALLIAAGADANAQDNSGWTPLHGAAHSGRSNVIGLLVAQGGADVNARNHEGASPAMLARAQAEHEVAKKLRVLGARD